MQKQQFLRYVMVGTSAYLIEMGSLFVLHSLLGLSSIMAVAISFWIGFSAAFVMQKWFAFRSHDKAVRTLTKQLIAYGMLAAWNYGFTLAFVALFTPLASVFVLRTIAIAIITLWNFTIYRIIFKSVAKETNNS